MSNALQVVCDENLFIQMQSYVPGYEGMIVYFRDQYIDPLPICKMMEEALLCENWKIVNKLYQFYNRPCKGYTLSPWNITAFHPMYPHQAYQLLSTCQWLHEHLDEKFPYWMQYMDVASCLGDIELVKYMHEHRPEGCTKNAMNWAAEHGHLEVVQFLHEHRHEGCTSDAVTWAAQKGHLNVVRFLHESRNEKCSLGTVRMALQNGHNEVFKYCKKNMHTITPT